MSAFTLQFSEDYFAVPVSDPKVRLPEAGLKDRGEFHITVINPDETRELMDRKGWTIERLRSEIEGHRFQSRPDYRCLGRAEDGENAVYFIVVKWPEAQEFRERLGLGPYDFHITLGFRTNDIHGIPKNASACIGKLREVSEPLTEQTLRVTKEVDQLHQAMWGTRLVEIEYMPVDGALPVLRLVEPYSFRDHPNGIVFYGWDVKDRRTKSFFVDRIRSVRVRATSFRPKWDVEPESIRDLTEASANPFPFGEAVMEDGKDPSWGTPGLLGQLMAESSFQSELSIEMPQGLMDVLKAIRSEGGQGIIVGGAVRDAMLGKRGKDIDVEVYKIPGDQLFDVLSQFGKVNAVGKSFGVYKLRLGGTEIDFSLPRKDRKVGAGHRGFVVDVDHTLTYHDAAKRRDFTINTLGYDPLTGTVYDPHGGIDDIKQRVIRMTDRTAFREDPLRVLRMAQFASRFGFGVDPETVDYAKSAPELETLPKERVFEEFKKALLRSTHPGEFVRALAKADALHRVVPDLRGKETEVAHLLDRAASAKSGEAADDLVLLLSAIGWESDPKFLASITNEVDLIRRVENAVALLRAAKAKWPETDEDIRRWLYKAAPENVPVVTTLARLIFGGPAEKLAQRVTQLGGQVQQIVLGRHLQDLGVRPGPLMGKLLKQLHDLQLAGKFSDLDGGLAAARELIAQTRTESTSEMLGRLFFT
jgi:tRNA nucleotidyltransferase (CCA-adding enzyme)